VRVAFLNEPVQQKQGVVAELAVADAHLLCINNSMAMGHGGGQSTCGQRHWNLTVESCTSSPSPVAQAADTWGSRSRSHACSQHPRAVLFSIVFFILPAARGCSPCRQPRCTPASASQSQPGWVRNRNGGSVSHPEPLPAQAVELAEVQWSALALPKHA